jgi:hypothetical protein
VLLLRRRLHCICDQLQTSVLGTIRYLAFDDSALEFDPLCLGPTPIASGVASERALMTRTGRGAASDVKKTTHKMMLRTHDKKTYEFQFERAPLLLREQPRRACRLQMLRNFGVSSDVSEVLGTKHAAVVAL